MRVLNRVIQSYEEEEEEEEDWFQTPESLPTSPNLSVTQKGLLWLCHSYVAGETNRDIWQVGQMQMMLQSKVLTKLFSNGFTKDHLAKTP